MVGGKLDWMMELFFIGVVIFAHNLPAQILAGFMIALVTGCQIYALKLRYLS